MDDMLGMFGPTEPSAEGETVQKKEVNYRPSDTEGGACQGCQHFVPPEGCTRVLGQIDPTGVCDLFEPAETEDMLDSGLDEFLFSGGM